MKYYLTLLRMAITKKSTDKFWNGCKEKGAFVDCWQECKLVQPLRRIVWTFLKITKNKATIWSSNPGERNDNPPQYSCLGNPMDRRIWRAPVHGVAKESDTTEHAFTTQWCSNPLLGIWPKKMKTIIQEDKCASMFINLVQWLNRIRLWPHGL